MHAHLLPSQVQQIGFPASLPAAAGGTRSRTSSTSPVFRLDSGASVSIGASARQPIAARTRLASRPSRAFSAAIWVESGDVIACQAFSCSLQPEVSGLGVR